MRFVHNRKIWYIVTLILLIPGIASLFINGLNRGIDFTGGGFLQLKFQEKVSTEQVRSVLDEFKLAGSGIQASENNTFFIRTKTLSQQEENKLLTEFKAKLGSVEVLRNENVGPLIGKELTMNAIYALIIASILMVIYITFRFEFTFGLAAVLALLQDVFIVIGVFSLLQMEIDGSFVAAILTIIGYAINDTIVIFDRIRENLHITKKMPLDELIDTSIKQSLGRSINTVLAVLFVLVALLLVGGETTRNMSFALIVGVTVGAYTSIFNASSYWYDLKRIFDGKKAVAKVSK